MADSKLTAAQIKKLVDELENPWMDMATTKKTKPAQPKEDFESFREKMLMISLRDAPEPAPEPPASAVPEVVKAIILYYTDNSINSDKVYMLGIVKEPKYKDAYHVNFSYGKRNKTMKDGTKTKIAVTYKEADNIFNSVITEKENEGYTTQLSGKPYAGVVRP